MAQKTSIEWTDATWNPVTGCTKVSPGCRNCYAARMAHRLQAMGQPRYRNGFTTTLQPDLLMAPLRWRKSNFVFVNSMSDLFHEAVPDDFIRHVFLTMTSARQHIFQILTKRAERLAALAPDLPWPPHVWMGVSVESEAYSWRVQYLRCVPASIRFISAEPLLGPIPRLPLQDIHWVIAGGESGPGSRPVNPDWVREIREQCRQSHTPFFFKQWGGTRKHKTGRMLDGREWKEMPVAQTPSG